MARSTGPKASIDGGEGETLRVEPTSSLCAPPAVRLRVAATGPTEDEGERGRKHPRVRGVEPPDSCRDLPEQARGEQGSGVSARGSARALGSAGGREDTREEGPDTSAAVDKGVLCAMSATLLDALVREGHYPFAAERLGPGFHQGWLDALRKQLARAVAKGAAQGREPPGPQDLDHLVAGDA